MGNKNKSWTKEEIKSAFYKYYRKHGRTPITTEMRNNNGLPSWKHVTEVFNIYSIEEFYKHIGLEMTKFISPIKISDETLKNECIRLFDILGRLPKKNEIENMCPFSIKPFNNLGGIKETFRYFGLAKNYTKTDEEIIQDSINEIIRISDELQKSPTVAEYDKLRICGYPRRTLEKKLNIAWNEILLEYSNYDTNIDTNITITKEEAIIALNNFAKKIGRTPKVIEIRKYNVGYGCKLILKTFEVNTIAEIYPIMGWELYGSDAFITSDDNFLCGLKDFIYENNRLPTTKEYAIDERLFSKSSYENKYGSIEEVCEILNVDYNEMKNNCGAGVICYDKNDELCKSLAEKEITNFLIDNNFIYKKESYYSELFEGDLRRFDWKIFIGSDVYYIEYFGMFRKNPKRSIDKKYYDKTICKINDLKKYNYIDRCIFIFPNHLNNKKYMELILNKISNN